MEEKAPVEAPQIPQRVSVPTELMNEVLSVLMQLPYSKVSQLIDKVKTSTLAVQDPMNQVPTPEQG